MKTLILTKQQARHLMMSLEGTGKGFNIGQLLEWHAFWEPLSSDGALT